MKSFEKFILEPLEPLVDSEIRESYIAEQYDTLLEKLITVGGKAYPNFGHIVIMAGGAGSGKGFVKDKLLGIEGFVFDVDELKTLASKTPLIIKKVKDEFGEDLPKLAANLRDPDNVFKLHTILGDAMGIDDKKLINLYTSILSAAPDRKPNIIFDVTLKDLRKLQKIANDTSKLGYKKQNVHIVWVINDVEVAIQQNAKRDRKVPVDILINTHRGAANTMGDILNMGKKLSKYMDGDIVFAFNKVGVDSEIVKGSRGGMAVIEAEYFYVKKQGQAPTPVKALEKSIRQKIQGYVPKNIDWS